jgi:uncharacterized protein (TIGR03435 family)
VGEPGQAGSYTEIRRRVVKPCKEDFGVGGRGGRGNSSPGRLNLNCQTVKNFIYRAYFYYRDGHFRGMGGAIPPLDGAPNWVESDHYSIVAKADGGATEDMMNGPMLQALLEDRFKLRIRRETREIPVYDLTVAKGGLKLSPFKQGSCVLIDWTKFPPLPELQPGQTACHAWQDKKEGNVILDGTGMSLDDFSRQFLDRLDRPVFNKTAVVGLFDFYVEFAQFAPDEVTPANSAATSNPAGPSIITALRKQLGLKLDRAKGPGDFLVIDHVEKPTEN